MMHHYTIFCGTRFKSSGDMKQTVMFWGFQPALGLTFRIGTQTLCTILQVMMIHRHTKFQSGSEDIRTNIPRWFEPSMWQLLIHGENTAMSKCTFTLLHSCMHQQRLSPMEGSVWADHTRTGKPNAETISNRQVSSKYKFDTKFCNY